MNRFPFPDKENSMEDLKRDYVFGKIEPGQVEAVFEDAWSVGGAEAKRFIEEYGGCGYIDMLEVFREKGFTVITKDVDYIVGKIRYFCEYTSRKNKLKIYKKSVELWCEENQFSYEEGLNVILCHEYFHYLECHKIGVVSGRCQVPMLRLGRVCLGRTGVPSLSEIAANAFANTCFELLTDRKKAANL